MNGSGAWEKVRGSVCKMGKFCRGIGRNGRQWRGNSFARMGQKKGERQVKACSDRLATLNKHARFSVGISVGRGGCWTAKRGSFGAKNRGYPCKEGKGAEGGAVGRPGNTACRECSLSLFGSYFFFSLSQSSPALRTASGSDAEMPQSLSGGSVSVRPGLTLSGSESLSRLALYI